MKAIFFEQHGGPEVWKWGELPLPEIGPGEALLKVRAVALNHLDIWVRRGWPGLKLPLPHSGGCDIVGEVVQIESGAGYTVGDPVFVFPGINLAHDQWTARGEESVSPSFRIIGEHLPGGFAEYVKVPIANLRPVPVGVSDESLAARLLTGLTCWRMLFTRGALQPGEQVLIVGAGGGVNSLAIQIAHAHKARVIAVAGGAEKCRRARELGAETVINYREDLEWSKRVVQASGGNGVDLVIDNVGKLTFTQSLRSLRWGGRLVTVGNTTGYDIALDNRLIFGKQLSIIGSTMGSRSDFDHMLDYLSKNKIAPIIDCVDSLANGITQLGRLERGEQFGKIVLKP